MSDSGSHPRYERHELRQRGAVETWSGLDRTLNRNVTIRCAAADSEIGQRLRLQAKALARVEHRGLLHILDTYDDGERFAIVTEQLPARLLADELAAPDGETQRLAPTEAIRIVIAVTEALAVLHSAGFAHGGVDADDVGWRAEVGWVILNGPPTDDTATIPATRNSDLASLAVLAHRLIVGAGPQLGPDGAAELDPRVPDALAPVLERAFSRSDPWPDASSMLFALRSSMDDLSAIETAAIDRRSVWQAERYWLAPVGILVAAAATLVGVAVVVEQPSRSPPATSLPPVTTTYSAPVAPAATVFASTATTAQPRAPATIAPTTTRVRRAPVLLESITDFDPAGDDRIEHPERLILINDGNPTTGWTTARYRTRAFGGLKDGVGLIVVLAGDEPAAVERVVIDSPTVGWAFELYTSNERNRTLIDWGSPVATQQDINGSAAVDVRGAPAAALLVWFTDLGEELPNGGHRVTVSGIEVTAQVSTAAAPPGTDAATP